MKIEADFFFLNKKNREGGSPSRCQGCQKAMAIKSYLTRKGQTGSRKEQSSETHPCVHA